MKQNLRGIERIATFALACLLFGSASIFIAACADEHHPRGAAPRDIDELKAAIATVLNEHGVPGVGLALVTKDQVLFAGGVGKADIAAGRDVGSDTAFRVASITKSFVALCALRLEEDGKLDLNAKVADIAPEIPVVNRWDATDPVRVVHLLEHTAGFNDFSLAEFYDFDAPPETPLKLTLQRFPGPQRVRWRPGTYVSYSNPGYGFAGYIVEKASGEDFAAYVASAILQPLAMNGSDMELNGAMATSLAQGYAGNPPAPAPYHPIYLRPASELKSTPADMARFVRMMLGRGELEGARIVSQESITRMEVSETSLAARARLKFTYGLGNYVAFARGFITHGHDGGIDGFLSRYAYLPEYGVGYFFSINSANGSAMNEINELVAAFMTRGRKKPATAPAIGDTDLARYAGFYEPAASRQQAVHFINLLMTPQFVTVDGGKLFRRTLLGERQQLIPVGPGVFRTSKVPVADTAFTTNPVGTEILLAAFPPQVPLPIAFAKTSPVWPMTRLALLTIAELLMLSSVLFALIWIPRKLFGRMKSVCHLSARVMPLLASIALPLSFAIPLNLSPLVLSTPNVFTVSAFVLSILFAVFSVLGLILGIRSFRWEINRTARIHSLLVSSAACGVAWYLAFWGAIGFRTWAEF